MHFQIRFEASSVREQRRTLHGPQRELGKASATSSRHYVMLDSDRARVRPVDVSGFGRRGASRLAPHHFPIGKTFATSQRSKP